MMLSPRTKTTKSTSKLPDSNKFMSNKKFIKCKKHISTKPNKVKCNIFNKLFHLKCTSLTKQQFQDYCQGKCLFNCLYCTNYTCLKCAKHTYDDFDSVS